MNFGLYKGSIYNVLMYCKSSRDDAFRIWVAVRFGLDNEMVVAKKKVELNAVTPFSQDPCRWLRLF